MSKKDSKPGDIEVNTALHTKDYVLDNSVDIYGDARRFRFVSLTSKDIIRELDLRDDSLWWNDNLYTVFGYTPADILPGNQGWWSRIHPDDLTPVLASLQETMAADASHWSMEYRFRRGDGAYADVLDRCLITRNQTGAAIQLFGIMLDITSRKAARQQAKQALYHSEERFRTLIEAIPQQVWTATPDGTLNYVNKRMTDYFGASSGTLLNKGWMDVIHPDDLRKSIKRWLHSLHSGEPYAVDFRLRRADGLYRWHIAMALPLRDNKGEITQWYGTSTDITAHKDVEGALLEGQTSLAEAQARAKLGSWRRDLLSNEATWSAEMYRIFGYDPSLPPPSFVDFTSRIHPEDRETFIHHYRQFLQQGNGYKLDFRLPQPNGDNLWIEARSETLRDESGRAIVLSGTAQDITSRKQAELALNTSESRFRAFMEKIPALAFIKDTSGRFVYVNPTFERVFDTPEEEILGKTVFDLWPIDIAQRLHDHDERIFASNQQTEALEDVSTPDGMRHWLSVKFVFTNADGQRFLGGTAIDLTDRYIAEQALRTSTQLLEVSQAIAKLGGWELDLETRQLFWTDETYRLHDTSPDEFDPTVDAGMDYYLPASRQILSDALNAAIHFGQGYDLELETLTAKGRKIDVRTTCTATLKNGKAIKLTGIFQDISEQKAAQLALETANRELARANSVLEHIAHYDALTHLPNRILLADRMQQAMIHNQRHGKSLAVAFLDLDGFKTVNDQYGHSVGDSLLITIAQKMRAALREGDTLARIGGDEFVAVLTDLKQAADCEPLLERLLQAAAEPVKKDDYVLQVSASIGVTIHPQDGVDAEQLMRHADQAMYLAKQAGKNCYHLFDIARSEAVKTQRESLERIRAALYNNEFVLYYQPKVNMRTRTVIGAEALIRWQHPERGLLPPAAFLPVIEDHLISVDIGEWVISTALAQFFEWQGVGVTLPISVNIGALQLQQPNFAERLKVLLNQAPGKPALELEILETSALDDIAQVSAVINACQALGVSFALDDFGTGYSSLAYLKRLPANLLKIDQSFVRDMLDDPDDLAIIKGIIGLAVAFRRQVIAEGVETAAHGEMLLAIGCDLAQGYGIARPMPARQIPQWVTTWESSS